MNIQIATKNRILELCSQRNITIHKLSIICGISQSTLKNIMGDRNGATVLTVKKICDGLGISIVDFFNTDEFKNLEQEFE